VPIPDVAPEPAPEPEPIPEIALAPAPEPEPAPIVEAQPQPSIQEPVSIGSVDLATLDPQQLVELDNGVILTAEVVIALQVFESPGELLTAILTDPAQALTALLNVGADMTPEVRKAAQKTVLASVIAGGIATNAAVSAAAGYRRKP
jgi:hypothetical protein